ncbi:hypothetical protein GQX74_004325 [Glossina fuscipes]|nr:hypothetical protein GQX74_004325 [Glossina fuscipes]
MERHRTLDSSMSSLYSGSNVSQTPTSRHHNDATMGATTSYNNYTGTIVSTSSAAPSPTPSAGHLLMATTNGNDNMIDTNANSSAGGGGGGGGSGGGGGGGGGGSSSSTGIGGLRATTIGTVVVRCGPIQLVIALLQTYLKRGATRQHVDSTEKISFANDKWDKSVRGRTTFSQQLMRAQGGIPSEFKEKGYFLWH